MADSTDNVLSILIKLGLVGEENIDAVKEKLKSLGDTGGASIKDLNREMGVVNVTQDELAKITGKTSEAMNAESNIAKRLGIEHRELHKIFGELNRVVPGLGEALQGLVTAAGPAIVVILAIQEAMELWHAVQEKNAKAAEELATRLDTMRTNIKNLREAFEEYDKTAAKRTDDQKEYLAELTQINAVLSAQLKVKQEILKVDEQAALANAKTPEEKAEIQNRFQATGRGLEQQSAGDQYTAITNERISLRNERSKIQAEIDDLHKQAADLTKAQNVEVNFGFGETDAQKAVLTHMANAIGEEEYNAGLKKLTDKITELTARVAELNNQDKSLATQQTNKGQIGAIESHGNAIVDILNQRDSKNGMTFAQLATATGKSHEQTINIVTGILNGTLHFVTVLQQMEFQYAALTRHLQNRPVN